MTARCHWVTSDGHLILIPGCWNRVHDPDAECTCGEWSEHTARATIRSMEASIYRERHRVQILRAELRKAGVPDPTFQPMNEAPAQYTARQRRRAMHKAITEAGQ